ncbi:MAG: transglutaminase domain-containing protein [Phycisphaeraceae bacterium]|nr:transglutaminase domain-containing protein [Phycisphaeraceae bacterium]MCW5753637.1 transglutaminase domain-containing protein [Phycisphaeraceae bacterium]
MRTEAVSVGGIGGVRRQAALVLATLVVCVSAALGQVRDRWYMLLLDGAHAGWMHEQTDEQDEIIITKSLMHLRLKRDAADMTIEIESEFHETISGEALLARVRQQMGAAPMQVTYRFVGDQIVMESPGPGDTIVTTHTARPEGVWLTPAAASRYLRERLAAGATEITARTLEPMTGLAPVTVTYRSIRRTTSEFQGRPVRGFSCLSETTASPGLVMEHVLAEDGTIIRTMTAIGSMSFVMLAADREVAQAAAEAPELMVRSFVKPDRRVPRARDTVRGTYLLHIPDSEAIEIPSVGAQRVRVIAPDRVEVDVDVHRRAAESVDEALRARALASTAMLRCDDEAIVALARKAVTRARAHTAAERAEALRREVYRHIRHKDLGVGFASASEVVRTRQGDCSEHAVLLAAMLRAEGIPSRIAAGIVYVDEFAGERHIFGYHMWTQALLNENGQEAWVDLDAAIDAAKAYDATHITLDVSTLGDDETIGKMTGMVQVFGRLRIEVLGVEHAAHVDAAR